MKFRIASILLVTVLIGLGFAALGHPKEWVNITLSLTTSLIFLCCVSLSFATRSYWKYFCRAFAAVFVICHISAVTSISPYKDAARDSVVNFVFAKMYTAESTVDLVPSIQKFNSEQLMERSEHGFEFFEADEAPAKSEIRRAHHFYWIATTYFNFFVSLASGLLCHSVMAKLQPATVHVPTETTES